MKGSAARLHHVIEHEGMTGRSNPVLAIGVLDVHSSCVALWMHAGIFGGNTPGGSPPMQGFKSA